MVDKVIKSLDIVAFVDEQKLEFKNVELKSKKYQNGDYILDVKNSDLLDLKLSRLDNKTMKVNHFEYYFSIPLMNFSKIIMPDCGRNYMLNIKPLTCWNRTSSLTAANAGNPFIAFLNQFEEVIFAVGVVSELIETSFRITEPGVSTGGALIAYSGKLNFVIKRPSDNVIYGEVKEFKDSLFVKEGGMSWFHVARDYADLFKERMDIEYPINEKSYLPVWCTWTGWLSDDLTEKLVIDNAKLAKKAGIKSIIIDDGWFGPGLDAPKDYGVTIGDYYPDKKFPNMKQLVKTIQDMDMMAILWIAPLAIHPKTKNYQKYGDLVVHNNGKKVVTFNGFSNLCPSNPEARRHMVDDMKRLITEYGVDGLKIDLYNCLPPLPCDATNHEHDTTPSLRGLHKLMAETWEELTKIKKDVTIELKNNYANIYSMQFGTMARAGDSPYDIDINFERCVYPQTFAQVVHNDYLAWTGGESAKELAALMIKLIAGGVPTFSIDLMTLPKFHHVVLKKWLDLYYGNIDLLMKTRREPQNSSMTVWQIDNGEEIMLILLSNAKEIIVPNRKKVIILNATKNDKILIDTKSTINKKLQSYDNMLALKLSKKMKIKSGDQIQVLSGGCTVLE
ncbi:MAG: hypothetical protein A2539_10440 [Elusimicrobia bacterium RIFOXYD2_FULL_34_15]|nr:MAG: hypothetical protein A2539_10440 [Elusimicrobia bacterium RIFOXYD2_FULL_34_15]